MSPQYKFIIFKMILWMLKKFRQMMLAYFYGVLFRSLSNIQCFCNKIKHSYSDGHLYFNTYALCKLLEVEFWAKKEREKDNYFIMQSHTQESIVFKRSYKIFKRPYPIKLSYQNLSTYHCAKLNTIYSAGIHFECIWVK